jgi:molybdopterin-guanine dinucleotide biosynthesis protein B
MHVAAITGFSGSGKTTLVEALIRRYVAEGLRVGAIKHTHHPLNEERRGDTGRFERAGAVPVIFASKEGAVVFRPGSITRASWSEPRDLLAEASGCDIVLVEGFKSYEGWPQVSIEREARPAPEELAAILDRIWRSS